MNTHVTKYVACTNFTWYLFKILLDLRIVRRKWRRILKVGNERSTVTGKKDESTKCDNILEQSLCFETTGSKIS